MATEIETETTVHWGARLPGFGGTLVRWDPSYGTGNHVPYTEEEARADVRRNPGATLVRRTETVVTTTTDWEEVPTTTPARVETYRTLMECPRCHKRGVRKHLGPPGEDAYICRYCEWECYTHGDTKLDVAERGALRLLNPTHPLRPRDGEDDD